MFLVRLIYASRASDSFRGDQIGRLLEAARENNTKKDVTGILCFHRNYFLQCLEGSRTAVNEVYHGILNDDRHYDPVLLDYTEIDRREFKDWSMAYLPDSSLTKDLNLEFSGSAVFNPFAMTGESNHQLLLKALETLPRLPNSE